MKWNEKKIIEIQITRSLFDAFWSSANLKKQEKNTYFMSGQKEKKNVSNNNGIFFIQWIGMILSTIFGRGRRFDAPHTVKKFTESNKLRKIKRNAFDSGSGDSVKWKRNRIQPWQQWVG